MTQLVCLSVGLFVCCLNYLQYQNIFSVKSIFRSETCNVTFVTCKECFPAVTLWPECLQLIQINTRAGIEKEKLVVCIQCLGSPSDSSTFSTRNLKYRVTQVYRNYGIQCNACISECNVCIIIIILVWKYCGCVC